MILTLIILLVSAALFMHGKIRADMVAICALLALMLTNTLTPTEGLAGFSNSIVIMMIGVFIVGGAIFRTGLARIISRRLLALAGTSQTRLFLLVMLVTSVIGAFVSNTGTVAVMLPIVVSMAATSGISPSRFLMPLAFASSMGGMLTLIGTPPNLVINNVLVDAGYKSLSLFSFFPVGVVCVSLGTLALLPMSKLLGKKKEKGETASGGGASLVELVKRYHLTQTVYRVRIRPSSPVIGKALSELDITHAYALTVVEIRRRSDRSFGRSVEQVIPAADTRLEARDIMFLLGDPERVEMFAKDKNLEVMDAREAGHTANELEDEYRFDAIGLAELVVLSTSRLVKQRVADSKFREKYHVNILGIQRNDECILHNLAEQKMQAGDALLVQGEWGAIARLTEEQGEWVVVGQPLTEASKLTLDHKAPVAAAIMLLMVLAMALDVLPTVTAVMVAAVAMIFTGCFRNVEEAYKTINWESVVLIAAMLPMATAIEKTGGTELAANSLVSLVGDSGPMLLLAAIYFFTSFLTLFISNTASAVLFAPIAIRSALEMGVSPYPFLFGVTVAASMCFASPFSSPPNALVMSAGRYTFMDYVKVGVPLQILFGVVMVMVLPYIFPF